MNDAQLSQDQIGKALRGEDMEAYYKLDASLHPEQKRPPGCSYAPHELAMTPEYQALSATADREQRETDDWVDCMKLIAGARDRMRDSADPNLLPKLGDDQCALLLAASKALAPFIGRAAGQRNDHQSAREAADAKLSQMTREYRKANV